MKVGLLLDQIEQELQSPSTRRIGIDRLRLLDYVEQELNSIAGLEQWDFLQRYINPIALTQPGVRNYPLPVDFPENFVQTVDTDRKAFFCKLDDGSRETFLEYVVPGAFFGRDLRQESNGPPDTFTITTLPNGQREIWMAPPPDGNSDTNYTLIGLYIPTLWEINEQDDLPPLPANASVLRFAVLRRVAPQRQDWNQEYLRYLSNLYLRAARMREAGMFPAENWRYQIVGDMG